MGRLGRWRSPANMNELLTKVQPPAVEVFPFRTNKSRKISSLEFLRYWKRQFFFGKEGDKNDIKSWGKQRVALKERRNISQKSKVEWRVFDFLFSQFPFYFLGGLWCTEIQWNKTKSAFPGNWIVFFSVWSEMPSHLNHLYNFFT